MSYVIQADTVEYYKNRLWAAQDTSAGHRLRTLVFQGGSADTAISHSMFHG